MSRTQTEMKVCLTLDHCNFYEIALYMALVLHCSTHEFASIKYMHKWVKEFSSSISQFQPFTSLEFDTVNYSLGLIV